jgi:hypothetical protein
MALKVGRFVAPKILRTRAVSFATAIALVFTSILAFTPGQTAEAGVSTTNLMMSLDASNSSSYSGSGNLWSDVSGNGRNATLTGAVTYTSSTSMFNFPGGANGTAYGTLPNTFTDLTNGFTVDFEGNFGSTVNAWERVIDIAPNIGTNITEAVLVGRLNATDQLFLEVIRGGVSQGHCYTTANQSLGSTARWTVGVGTTGGCRIFKNGVAQAVSSDGTTPGNWLPPANATRSSSWIGRSNWTGDSDLEGQLRYVRIYNRGLSDAEALANVTGNVTFNSNGAPGSMPVQSSIAPAVLSSNSLTYSGYTFAGWNTAINGSGRAYANGASYAFTTDATLYAQWTLNAPSVSAAASIAGTAKVGQTITATAATYVSGTSPTVSSRWQYSNDNSTWTDIAGATALSYVLVAADAGTYVRFKQDITNATGTVTSFSSATTMVLSSSTVTGTAAATSNVGSMFTVPSGSTVYNVTLVSSNLAGAFSLGTTTNLTWVEGYSSTASYMPANISGSGSIFSFRGTGDAINTALATLTYTSSTVQTDALRMYSAAGSSAAQDIRNYIPIYDNGKLTYHYYSVTVPYPTTYNRAYVSNLLTSTYAMSSAGDAANATVTSLNPWYLETSRYAVENTRASALTTQCGSSCWAMAGGLADVGSSQWYWPATDGYSSTSNVSYTNWAPTNPNLATTIARSQNYIASGGVAQWDDQDAASTVGAYLAETYSTTPLSSAVTAQTYRAVAASNAPTALAVTPNTKFSVGLTWTVPSSLGTDALTNYSIQYSTDQSSWTTWAHAASTTASATVTGLTPGQAYWFRVAAVTSVTGAYSSAVSSMQADTGMTSSLTGYSVPSDMTGTIRVLLWSSNAAGKFYFGSVANIDGGIRNTANWPDNNSYTPLTGNNPASLSSPGRMVGLVDTSVTDLNAALATLKYSSATSSTDTIKMWVSNGTEYIPIINGSNVEFHYYGYVSASVNWSTAQGTGNGGAARTIDGVTLAAGTPFLATPRYRAEAIYVQSLAGTNHAWLNASDAASEGVWKWLGADANGVQFSNGSTAVNGEFTNWGSGNATEPNGSTGANCMYNYYGPYTGNTIPTSGVAWDDTDCAVLKGYAWEAFNTNAPLGSNGTTSSAANYAPVALTQTVSVVAPAAAPTTFTATSPTAGQVDLSWVAPASVIGITSYSVQYSADGSTWTEARSTTSTALTQSISSLSSGTYYQFRVAAIISSGTGAYATTYFTPNGASRVNAVVNVAKNITSLAVDSGLALRQVRVVLRTSVAGATLSLSTPGSTGAVRGTSNYTTRSAAGQMIGLTGTGAAVNTALQSLQYTGPSSGLTDSISLWVSAGTTTALPQEFVPVVNAQGQVDFHYFGYSSSSLSWGAAVTAAQSNVTTINGQAAAGKYLATAESADQNALVSAAAGTNAFWLNGGDYTTVSSTNADAAWYWLGPDTGVSQFYNGNQNSGTGGIVNSSFVAWAATSLSAQAEPNGTVNENCLSYSGSAYALTNSGFTAVAGVGGVAWNDNSCAATQGYVWEYMAAAPVGIGVVGDNFSGMTAQAILVNPNADAPTGVVATGTGTTSAVVSWSAPTVYNTTALSGYKVEYSTSPTFASGVSTINGTSTSTFQQVTGLTANTTYYFRVTATGSGWTGLTSSTSSAATKASGSPTTLTVVATGGGVAGTDYSTTAGMVAALTSASVSINASDLATILAANADVKLLADTVTISSAVAWSANARLQLGIDTSSRVSINADLTADGSSAGLIISPDYCAYSSVGTYTSCYTLDTKSGANVTLSGGSSTLKIAGLDYTVIRSEAALSTVTALGQYALAGPLSLSTNYSGSPVNLTFAGKFDGLGNAVNGMTITPTVSVSPVTSGGYGFFRDLGGANIRNVGFTNVNISSSTANLSLRLGGVAGNGSSAGTNTISQVWATGFVKQTATTGAVEAGGLFGGATGGTLNVSKSWSSVAVTTNAPSVGSGGIIGTNTASFSGGTGAGNTLVVDESYSTGNILRTLPSGAPTYWYGNAGIIGVAYGASTTLRNVFSWGNINSTGSNPGTSTAGISGVGSATITNAYTSYSSCGGSPTNCVANVVAGSAVSGFSSGLWSTVNGASLVNLAPPTKSLYVQVVAPSDGSYGGISYKILDSTGTEQTASDFTAKGLTVSGTPVYTVDSTTAFGTYNVNYVSGLTLGGSSAGVYSLNAWITATAVTISGFNQTVSWAPTTSIPFGAGTYTPAAASASGGTTLNYSVTSAGATGCSVNLITGQLTYTAAGSCTVMATALAGGNYVKATTSATFTIGAPASTLTIVTTGGGVDGTNFAIANGTLTAAAGASVSVNASDITAALATGSLKIIADSIVINAPLNWSSNSVLTLGISSTSSLAINADIVATGASAGFEIAAATYSLATRTGTNVVLSGSFATLKIGGIPYTVINTIAGLANIGATGNYAITAPLSLTLAYSTALRTAAFTGTLDGFGNTIDGYRVSASTATNLGLFATLGDGSTVRNLGMTNMSINAGTATSDYVGGIAAQTSGTATLTQVWATGNIKSTPSTLTNLAVGGLVGNATAGTITISKSWSSVGIDTTATTASNTVIAGILGSDVSLMGQGAGSPGATVAISEVYNLGNIRIGPVGWSGVGGITGLNWSTATVSITDAFNWGTMPTTWGGITGSNSGGAVTITRAFTTTSYCTPGTSNTCTVNAVLGGSGIFSGSNWTSSGASNLANLSAPVISLYVQPTFSGTTGSVNDLGYQIVDSSGAVVTPSTLGLTVTGTASYLPASLTASATAYAVSYDTGLTLGGANQSLYSLSNWVNTTAVTISRTVGTISWSPSTAFTRTDSGGATLALPTTNSNATIAYSVLSGSCAITSSRVLTFTATGTCQVKADVPLTTTFTATSATVTITVSDSPPIAPVATIAAGIATGQVTLSWTAPSTATTGGTIASYNVDTSTDGTTWTSNATGLTGTSKTVTGLTNGTPVYMRVQAVNGAGALGAWSSTLSATPYWKPLNTVAPTISGSAVGGETMTSAVGTWDANGSTVTSTTYQWQSSANGSTGWSDIAGATSSSYVVTGLVGSYLSLKVTQTNAAGSTTVTTGNSSQVQSGLASAPQTVTATRGNAQVIVNWTAPATTNGGTITYYKVEYQLSGAGSWTAASSTVAASATAYTITGLTNGNTYLVRVTALTLAGAGTVGSAAASVIPSTTATNTVAPTVAGTVAAGRPLTGTAGTWTSGGSAPTLSYKWQSSPTGIGSWTDIAGATTLNFTPTSAEVGLYLQLVETATNAAGISSANSLATTVVLSGLAGAPTAVTPVAANGQLTVTWTAPLLLNGGVISNYEVSYRASGASVWTVVSRTASTTASQVITGLTNGTAYDIQIGAITAAGTGAYVTYTAAQASTPFTTPSNSAAPSITGTAAVSRVLTAADGTWNDNGRTSTLTYVWQSSPDNTTWTAISGATSSTFTPTTTQLAKYIRVNVTATNAAGALTVSSLATTVVLSGLASVPQAVAAVRGNTVANVSWAVPASLNGGVLSGYRVEYKLSSGSTWSSASVSSSTLAYQITGLTNGSAYDVRVFAVTAAGDSVAGVISGTVTPSTTASNTVAPAVTGTAAVGAVLTTNAGTWSTGGETPSYTYQWQVSATGLGSWSDISGATGTTYTVTAAESGSFIRSVVTATNGSGAVSAASNSTTVVLNGLAAAPTALSVAAGNAQLALSWTTPSLLNGGVISNYVIEYRVSGATNWTTFTHTASTSTSATITGLTNASAYDWRVSAVTAAGAGTIATYTAALASTPFTTASYTSGINLSGTAAVSRTLSTTDGTWVDNGRSITYSYKWQFSSDGSTGWADITGETSSTLTLASAQSGTFVRSTVIATNAAGATTAYSSASSQIQTGLPSAPQSITATRGNATADVSWSAPATLNGGVLSGYQVQYKVSTGSTWTTAATVADTATAYQITNLTNGTAYDIRVIASTGAGLGTAGLLSGTVIPSTTASNTFAPALTGTVAVGRTLTSSTGTWNTGGETPTYSYQWQISPTGLGTWSDISAATGSTYTLTAGDLGKFIRSVVTATNGSGAVTATSASTVAADSGLAGAASNLIAGADNQQLTLNWTAPATLNGGVISDYIVQYRVSGTTTWTTFTRAVNTATSATITGLTNATAYDWRVAAVTAAGAGTAVEYVADLASTPYTVPTNIAVPTTSGVVAVSGSVSALPGSWNNNGRTESYTYQWQVSANGTTGWTDISGATSSSFTVVTAQSGKYLRVATNATNAAGSTIAYSMATVAADTGLATAPQSITATRTDAALAVSWSAPADLHGGVIANYIVQYSTNNSTWTTASNTISAGATAYTVTGLTNGTSYYVRIAALTGAGQGALGALAGTATPSTVASNSVAPIVSGTAAASRTFSVNTGSWNTGGAALSYSYQWQVSATGIGGWSDLTGATTSTYPVTSAEVGKYLRAVVTATNVAGSTATGSTITSVVLSGLANAPTGLGVAFSPMQLDVSWTGAASINGAAALTGYQVEFSSDGSNWTVASSTLAANATSATIATGLTSGTSYDVRVAALTAAGIGAYAITTQAVLFGGVPAVSVSPVVSGRTAVGETLSATNGTWDDRGVPISATTFQWQRSVDNASWTDISGATASTFTASTAESGFYVRVQVSATNSVGTTPAYVAAPRVIETGLASSPRTVTAIAGDHSVALSWTAPASLNGAALLGYTVQYSTNGTSWIDDSTAIGAADTTYTVTGLANGVTTYVRVFAMTAAGAGTMFTSSALVPAGVPLLAFAPSVTGTTAVGVVLTAVTGSWGTNGQTISGYTYQWQVSANGLGGWTDISGATLSTFAPQASGEQGKYVRVRVSAVNSVGASLGAYSGSSTQIDTGLASSVRNVALTRGNTTIDVAWSAPLVTSGGTISGYTVQLASMQSNGSLTSYTTAATTNSSASSIQLTGLSNGTAYMVRVTATTAAGDGTFGVSPTTATPATTPSNTVVPAVTGTLRSGYTLSATSGDWSDNGDAISLTSYQWQRSVDGNTWVNISTATQSHYVPSGVVGQQLRVKVDATNAVGSTSSYSAATTVIGVGTPGAPTGLALTPGDTSVLATWSAPVLTGEGTISDYTVELSSDGGSSWTAISRSASTNSQQTVSGLTIGADYLIRVRTETGQSSAWATTSTYTAIGKPTNTALPAVTGTTLVGQTLTASTGTWNTNGSPLSSTSYRWQESTDSGQSWVDVPGSASTITAAAGRIYRSIVSVTNLAGVTEAASSATPYVVSAIPSAPGSLTVTPGDTQLTAVWQVPATLGGAPVVNYIVEYSDDGNTWITVSRTPSATASQVITGLTNGGDYYVRVRAQTTVLGSWANAVPSAPPFGAPFFLGGTIIAHGSTVPYASTLTASTGAWDPNGASIDSYSYQWLHSVDGTTWLPISGSTASTYTVGAYVGERMSVVVTAHSSMGPATAYQAQATPVVNAIASTPVRNLALTVGDQQLTASWTAPASLGGAPLSSYRVQYSTDQSQWTTVTRGDATAISETITGLSNGSTYYVRVVALTALTGQLAFSGSSVTPFGLPLVTNIPAVSGTTRFASTLSADAGSWNSNGDPLSAATYQWQVLTGSTWQTISGATGNSYTIDSYVGSALRVAVTRTNAAGSVTAYSAQTAAVAPDAPNAPTNLSVAAADMSLAVTWTAPSYVGGLAITDYLVEYSTNGTSWTTVTRSASATTSQEITGLTNGDGYFVRVRALNGASGAAVASGTAVIPRGVPINTVTPAIMGTATFGRTLSVSDGTWHANGSIITGITYQWQSFDGSTWIAIPAATSSSYTIGALVGKTIRVALTATNAVGHTLTYSSTTSAVSLGAISAPQALTVIAADQQLELSWLAPSSSGGLAVTDYEIQVSTDANTWSTATRTVSPTARHTVASLTNGESYYVRVRAKVGGSTGSWVFAPSTFIPRGTPVATTAVSVAGNARFGSALFSDLGTWDDNGDSITATTYQWQASRDGLTWTNIPGATSGVYQVGLYVGSTLRVLVARSNAAGSTVSTSAPTATVTAIAAATPVLTSQSTASTQITVGWTPPAHSGGETLAGYTLQYSTDQFTWTSLSVGPTETQAVITGLMNGTGYVVRVRAETTQHGSWSPAAGPFTPVAPPAPAPVIAVSPFTAPSTTPSPSPIASLLMSQIMPFALVRDSSGVALTLRSETGPAPVVVTSDGRIELQPTQSIALLNGAQTPATMQTTGSSLTVSAADVTFQVDFSVSAGVLSQGSQLTISGEGFQPNTPLVTWLQSSPIKIGQSISTGSGDQDLVGSIPADVSAGEHTLQLNGVNAQGHVVSVIYGVTVAASEHSSEQPAWVMPLWLIAIAVVLLLAFLVIRSRAARRPVRSKTHN